MSQGPETSVGPVADDRAPVGPSRGLRRLLVLLLALVAVVTVVGVVALRPEGAPLEAEALNLLEQRDGTVLSVEDLPCPSAPFELPDAPVTPEDAEVGTSTTCRSALVRLDEGEDAGRTTRLDVGTSPLGTSLEEGDGVVLATNPEAAFEQRYSLRDRARAVPLLVLGLLFAAAVVALGRWRGLAALAGLVVSAVLIAGFLVPALLAGGPPLLVALVGGTAIALVVLPLAHGVSWRTAAALLGTLASLALTAALGAWAVPFTALIGTGAEDALVVSAVFGDIDLRGLLLAGLVIGALGVLDDVTVTQASAVWELRRADPTAPTRRLVAAGVRIGRDHVAATVNTLLLAYAGAALPLLVVFSAAGTSVGDALTTEVVAAEVVRTLVGSLGLVAAVPITTLLAAAVCRPLPSGEAGSTEEPAGDRGRVGAHGDDPSPARRGLRARARPRRSPDRATGPDEGQWLDQLRGGRGPGDPRP